MWYALAFFLLAIMGLLWSLLIVASRGEQMDDVDIVEVARLGGADLRTGLARESFNIMLKHAFKYREAPDLNREFVKALIADSFMLADAFIKGAEQ